MNIFRLIVDNLRRGTVSFPLPHDHECTSSEYRGLILNDASRCIGCSSCAYVCPTGAIEVSRSGDTYRWSYDAGKCTFCARCIDRCRPCTLTMESKLPPLYRSQGELKVVLDMVKKKPVRHSAPPVSVSEKEPVILNSSPAPAETSVSLTVPLPNPEPAA